MFYTEPMLTCVAIYASFVYGLLFLTLEVFPIVFREQRHYGLVISTLPFLGLFIGVACAIFVNLANQPLYLRAVAKNKGRSVPEARLPPMIIGGVLFSTGLFWFGWTADPKYSWASPTVAAGKSSKSSKLVVALLIHVFKDLSALDLILSSNNASTSWWTLTGLTRQAQSLQTHSYVLC